MKKLSALLVVAVLVLLLFVGCAAKNSPAPQAVENNASQAQNAKPNEPVADVSKEDAPSAPKNESAPMPGESAKPDKNKPSEKPVNNNPAPSSAPSADVKVSKEEAKAAALKHAGLSENEVNRYRAELDRERGGLVYEIEFESGKYEYDYEVSADDGRVLKAEKEYRD